MAKKQEKKESKASNQTVAELFQKFGEFDSVEELNLAAAGLKEEGDIESLGILAKENGLEEDDVEMYLSGDTEQLADVLSAAIGKLNVEKEKENNILVDDIVDYLMANCDDEKMARAVRKKGKRTMEAAKLVADEAKKNRITIPGGGSCSYCGPMKGYQIIRSYYMEG